MFPELNRQRVHLALMDEIGYENCDWISVETEAGFWSRFSSWPLPLELDLPCRDPIDHLMSQCNFERISFNCTESMEKQINSCLKYINRFSENLANLSNVGLKCYQFDYTFPMYIEYMETRLHKKRIETDYIFQATNKDRIKKQECIWNSM
jgi:hypothetical protein